MGVNHQSNQFIYLTTINKKIDEQHFKKRRNVVALSGERYSGSMLKSIR